MDTTQQGPLRRPVVTPFGSKRVTVDFAGNQLSLKKVRAAVTQLLPIKAAARQRGKGGVIRFWVADDATVDDAVRAVQDTMDGFVFNVGLKPGGRSPAADSGASPSAGGTLLPTGVERVSHQDKGLQPNGRPATTSGSQSAATAVSGLPCGEEDRTYGLELYPAYIRLVISHQISLELSQEIATIEGVSKVVPVDGTPMELLVMTDGSKQAAVGVRLQTIMRTQGWRTTGDSDHVGHERSQPDADILQPAGGSDIDAVFRHVIDSARSGGASEVTVIAMTIRFQG